MSVPKPQNFSFNQTTAAAASSKVKPQNTDNKPKSPRNLQASYSYDYYYISKFNQLFAQNYALFPCALHTYKHGNLLDTTEGEDCYDYLFNPDFQTIELGENCFVILTEVCATGELPSEEQITTGIINNEQTNYDTTATATATPTYTKLHTTQGTHPQSSTSAYEQTTIENYFNPSTTPSPTIDSTSQTQLTTQAITTHLRTTPTQHTHSSTTPLDTTIQSLYSHSNTSPSSTQDSTQITPAPHTHPSTSTQNHNTTQTSTTPLYTTIPALHTYPTTSPLTTQESAQTTPAKHTHPSTSTQNHNTTQTSTTPLYTTIPALHTHSNSSPSTTIDRTTQITKTTSTTQDSTLITPAPHTHPSTSTQNHNTTQTSTTPLYTTIPALHTYPTTSPLTTVDGTSQTQNTKQTTTNLHPTTISVTHTHPRTSQLTTVDGMSQTQSSTQTTTTTTPPTSSESSSTKHSYSPSFFSIIQTTSNTLGTITSTSTLFSTSTTTTAPATSTTTHPNHPSFSNPHQRTETTSLFQPSPTRSADTTTNVAISIPQVNVDLIDPITTTATANNINANINSNIGISDVFAQSIIDCTVDPYLLCLGIEKNYNISDQYSPFENFLFQVGNTYYSHSNSDWKFDTEPSQLSFCSDITQENINIQNAIALQSGQIYELSPASQICVYDEGKLQGTKIFAGSFAASLAAAIGITAYTVKLISKMKTNRIHPSRKKKNNPDTTKKQITGPPSLNGHCNRKSKV